EVTESGPGASATKSQPGFRLGNRVFANKNPVSKAETGLTTAPLGQTAHSGLPRRSPRSLVSPEPTESSSRLIAAPVSGRYFVLLAALRRNFLPGVMPSAWKRPSRSVVIASPWGCAHHSAGWKNVECGKNK